MLFKKKIYPEAYIKLFLETVYNRFQEHNEFCADGFSPDELTVINDTTYYTALIFVFNSLRINFWNSEEQFCVFFQAFEIILKQKDFNDNYIDQERRKLFDYFKEVDDYLRSRNSGGDIGFSLYTFCNNKICTTCEINMSTDENFTVKSALIAAYTKSALKQISPINDAILKQYSLRKD